MRFVPAVLVVVVVVVVVIVGMVGCGERCPLPLTEVKPFAFSMIADKRVRFG